MSASPSCPGLAAGTGSCGSSPLIPESLCPLHGRLAGALGLRERAVCSRRVELSCRLRPIFLVPRQPPHVGSGAQPGLSSLHMFVWEIQEGESSNKRKAPSIPVLRTGRQGRAPAPQQPQ